VPAVISERNVGPVTLLELGQRLTGVAAGELHQRLGGLIEAGRTELLLECSQIKAIDSQALGTLVREWVSAERHGGKLKLLRLSPRMQEALTFTRLHSLIESFDDVSAALRSF
jgi:anti-anti-sigma factor